MFYTLHAEDVGHRELLEIITEASAAFVEEQFHTARYIYSKARKFLSKLNIINDDRYVIEYVLCIALLESNTLHDILQALEILTKLEQNCGNSFPAIYYAIGKAYIQLYRFNSAVVAINKGFAILNAGIYFKSFHVPMTNLIIKESTKEGLLIALMNLHDKASSWHCADAKCYMEDCQNYVPHCLPCRDIYFKDPAFKGLIVVTCSNTNNPCKLAFHPVCWNFQKMELVPLSNSSEKAILGSPCFTIDCRSNSIKNIITRIEIFDNNAKLISVIKNSIPEIQPISNSPVTGAIRKYPLKTYSNLRRPTFPEHFSSQQIHSKEQSEKEIKLAKLVKLRKINLDMHHGQDIKLHKNENNNGHLDFTTNILLDLSSKNNNTETIKQNHFLFEIIYELVKSNSMIHIDKILSKWHEKKKLIEHCTDIHEYLDSDIIEVLLKSSHILKIGNYICISETLPQTLQLFEHKIIQQCKYALQIETPKENCDLCPTVNDIISHKEIITSFENHTNQNPERLQCSTSNAKENNNEENNNLYQNSNICVPSVSLIKSNSFNKENKYSIKEIQDIIDWNEYIDRIGRKDNIQIFDKEDENKMYFDGSYKIKPSTNYNDIKNNNQEFTETIIFNAMQNTIKENMTKHIVENNVIKQLTTVNELSSELKILQEKYTRLITNYSIIEQTVTKLTKEKADMEHTFKLHLEKKNSIMEDFINERKVLIEKLETYETQIAKDILIKDEVLNESQLASKSEITTLKQRNLDNENSIRLLLEEKNAIEITLKKKNAQLLESIKHYQAEINKKNIELINLQDKNLELKKSMLENSLESQYCNYLSFLVPRAKHCQLALKILTNLNYVVHRHLGFAIVSDVNIWLQTYNRFRILSLDLKKEYGKLKSLLDSKVEVAKMDKIIMKSLDLPQFPTQTLDTIICDAFIMLYNAIKSTQSSSLKFQPTPLLSNCAMQHPTSPNKFNVEQCSKEDTSIHSNNINESLEQIIDQIGKVLADDKHQNISKKLDLNVESKRNAKCNNKDRYLKDNEHDIKKKKKEYIKVNNQIMVEDTTNKNSPIDRIFEISNPTKLIFEPTDEYNNVNPKFVLKSKINKTMKAKNIENTAQKSNRIVANSTDKLMNILRNEYTGISELSLLKSLSYVRRDNNGSLTGMSFSIIFQYVKKYILLSQIDHLCTDHETENMINNTTTVVKERKKRTRSKIKGKSSNDTVKSLKNLSLQSQTKSKMNNQTSQDKPLKSTLSEPGSSKKCPWSIIVKPGVNKKHYEEFECVICMEDLQIDKKIIYTLDCQHKFHKMCIKDWFQQNQSCPICRIHCTIDEEYPPLP